MGNTNKDDKYVGMSRMSKVRGCMLPHANHMPLRIPGALPHHPSWSSIFINGARSLTTAPTAEEANHEGQRMLGLFLRQDCVRHVPPVRALPQER